MKWIAYFLSKTLYGLLVLGLVITLISSIIFLGEVDPTQLQYGQRASDQTIEAQRQELGLDLPFYQQVGNYFTDISPVIITSNPPSEYRIYKNWNIGEKSIILKAPHLGFSYQNGKNVLGLISGAFPVTLLLALTSFFIAIVIGIPLGVIAAYYFEKPIDRLILSVSTLGYSLPSYVVAIIFAIIFAYYLYPFTNLNIQGSVWEVNEIGDDIVVWKNLILPAFALGIRPLSMIIQITRSSVLDIKNNQYVQTAYSKGLTQFRVWTKHIIKNALNPIVTALSGWLASLLAGAFFVETVFNFRGLGSLTVNALLNYDVPLLLGCIVFTSTIFIIINIGTDLFYLWIDPKASIDS